jgi:hypothetical protein
MAVPSQNSLKTAYGFPRRSNGTIRCSLAADDSPQPS